MGRSIRRFSRIMAALATATAPSAKVHTHWGCFGYCNGPINPRPYWGCFGYCPGPLNPHPYHPYWGCFGYCNGPLNPRPYWGCYGYCSGPINSYPVAVPVPYPVYGSNPYSVASTDYAQAPSTTVTLPAPEEVKTTPKAQKEEKPKTMEDFIQDLGSKKARVRGAAAAALAKFGDKAKAAIPALIKLLQDNDPNIRLEATITLAKIGPDSLLALEKALDSTSKLTRMGAALTLGHLGSAAKPAEPALKKLLKDSEEDVRCHAAQALFRIDPETAKSVVPVLTAALDSLNPYIRLCAIGTLSRIGPAAKDAVAKLKNCLKDEDYHLRMSAAIAIGQVDPSQDATAIDTLRIALQEPSPAVRMEAAQILGELGAKSKPVIQSIGKLLSDPNAGVSRAAAIALSRIGPDAIPELEKALKSESVDVRRNAVVALINLGETSKEAAPALRIAAKDGDETVRLLAVNGLKNMEEEAKEKSAPK